MDESQRAEGVHDNLDVDLAHALERAPIEGGLLEAIAGSDAYMSDELKEAPELAGDDVDRVFPGVCSETAIELQTEVWTRLLQ